MQYNFIANVVMYTLDRHVSQVTRRGSTGEVLHTSIVCKHKGIVLHSVLLCSNEQSCAHVHLSSNVTRARIGTAT